MNTAVQVWSGPLFKYWGSTRWLSTDHGNIYLLTGQALEKRELTSGHLVWSVPCSDRVMVGTSVGVVVTCKFRNQRVRVGYSQFKAFSSTDGRSLWVADEEVQRPLWEVLELESLALDLGYGPIALLDKPRLLLTGEPVYHQDWYRAWEEWRRSVSIGCPSWRIGRDLLIQNGRILHLLEWPNATPALSIDGIAGVWVHGSDQFGLHGLEPGNRCFTVDRWGRLTRQVDYGSSGIVPLSGRLGGLFQAWAETPIHHQTFDALAVKGRFVFLDTRVGVSLRVYGHEENRVAMPDVSGADAYLVGGSHQGVLVLCAPRPDRGVLYYVTCHGGRKHGGSEQDS